MPPWGCGLGDSEGNCCTCSRERQSFSHFDGLRMPQRRPSLACCYWRVNFSDPFVDPSVSRLQLNLQRFTSITRKNMTNAKANETKNMQPKPSKRRHYIWIRVADRFWKHFLCFAKLRRCAIRGRFDPHGGKLRRSSPAFSLRLCSGEESPPDACVHVGQMVKSYQVSSESVNT